MSLSTSAGLHAKSFTFCARFVTANLWPRPSTSASEATRLPWPNARRRSRNGSSSGQPSGGSVSRRQKRLRRETFLRFADQLAYEKTAHPSAFAARRRLQCLRLPQVAVPALRPALLGPSAHAQWLG